MKRVMYTLSLSAMMGGYTSQSDDMNKTKTHWSRITRALLVQNDPNYSCRR